MVLTDPDMAWEEISPPPTPSTTWTLKKSDNLWTVEHEHENILSVIRNTSALIQTEHLPGMDYTSVLLNQLFNMYKQV